MSEVLATVIIRHRAFRHSWRVQCPCPAAEQSECLLLRDPHPSGEIRRGPFSGPFFHHFFKPHFFMTFIPKCLQIGVPEWSKITKQKTEKSRPQNAPTVKTCKKAQKHHNFNTFLHEFLMFFPSKF